MIVLEKKSRNAKVSRIGKSLRITKIHRKKIMAVSYEKVLAKRSRMTKRS